MALYKHIIAPLDGSELSEQSLPAAHLIAQATGAEVTLVRGFQSAPQWQVDVSHGRHSGSLAAAEHDRVFAYLSTKKRALQDMGVASEIHVAPTEGAPVDAITRTAASHPDGLIVMSTHGRSGLTRMMVGSVTARVVRAVKNPTLVVRCNSEGRLLLGERFDNIIVPLDGSRFAQHALHHAAGLAALTGAKLTLCQSTQGSDYFETHTEWGRMDGEAGVRLGGPSELSDKVSDLSVDYLQGRAADMEATFGLRDVGIANYRGMASEAIVNLAGELGNALVVMTTHGRRGVGRAILGSVADQVVLTSPAPTLLVRGPVAKGAVDSIHAGERVGAGA